MTELTPAQQDIIDALKKAYERYNALVQRMIDVSDAEYDTIHDLRMSIMAGLSESLHEAGKK